MVVTAKASGMFCETYEYMHLLGSNLSKVVFHLVMSRSLWLRLYLVSCQKFQVSIHCTPANYCTSNQGWILQGWQESHKTFFQTCLHIKQFGRRQDTRGINDELWVCTWLKAQKTALLYALLQHKFLLAFVIHLHNYMYTKGLLTS